MMIIYDDHSIIYIYHSFVYLQKPILVYLQKHTFVKRLFFENVRPKRCSRMHRSYEAIMIVDGGMVDRAILDC